MRSNGQLHSLLAILFLATAHVSALYVKHAPRAVSPKGVIIQLFEWTWDSVAAECTNFIGPAGYGYVQVSPPAEHIQGTQWWTDYQPVSYTLTSKRGSRSQFQNMINTCHSAGVEVIVDTIWNHMSGQDSGGTGVGGSSFSHYNYPGIYQTQDFHHSCGAANDDIADYTNRYQVQNCELVNLADLATETEYVRARLATYANDLLSLGADGLRLDAAKHIPATDISNILSRLSKSVYITQEVIFGSGEPITPSEYVGNGPVQEFRYTSTLKDAFNNANISPLQDINNRGWISSDLANVFVANHDTERGGSSLSYKSSNNAYVLATIFSLSFPYGHPTILSSYQFSSNDAGAPNGGAGTCSGSGGSNGWNCEHRWTAIAGMVKFYNKVKGTSLTNWVSGSSSQIAFGRGSVGFVAINSGSSSWTRTFTTSLPNGNYCNVISGAPISGGGCSGASFTVSGGSFTATVGARNAIAIHTGALGSGTTTAATTTTISSTSPAMVAVTFAETATTTYGENIFVVGSISQLGNWAPDNAIALSSAEYPVWKATVSIPGSTTFQYKYIKKTSSGGVVWESDPNRSYTTGSGGSVTLNDSWR
ncbi:hypothetical protein FRC03_011826 [Tulasnella sp. 419]|nr:hypothetical protein FRC03_011826 [Tulasnella sp. 419]